MTTSGTTIFLDLISSTEISCTSPDASKQRLDNATAVGVQVSLNGVDFSHATVQFQYSIPALVHSIHPIQVPKSNTGQRNNTQHRHQRRHHSIKRARNSSNKCVGNSYSSGEQSIRHSCVLSVQSHRNQRHQQKTRCDKHNNSLTMLPPIPTPASATKHVT